MPRTALLPKGAVKKSERQTVRVDVAKLIVRLAKRGDTATLNMVAEETAALLAVITQSGDGNGKRFSGAVGHDPVSQLTALENILAVGNVPHAA